MGESEEVGAKVEPARAQGGGELDGGVDEVDAQGGSAEGEPRREGLISGRRAQETKLDLLPEKRWPVTISEGIVCRASLPVTDSVD